MLQLNLSSGYGLAVEGRAAQKGLFQFGVFRKYNVVPTDWAR